MNEQLLWFIARGSGVVSLLMLTGVVTLGLAGVARFERPGWPRFLTTELHNNLALMSVAFVAIHVATVVLDPWAELGWLAAVVPFTSWYRPLWVGLGVISVYLFGALVVTSLLRHRLSQGTWRLIHWLAYLAWPMAFLHSAGAGSDAGSWWMLPIQGSCALLVAFALAWRVFAGRARRQELPAVVAASPRAAAPFGNR